MKTPRILALGILLLFGVASWRTRAQAPAGTAKPGESHSTSAASAAKPARQSAGNGEQKFRENCGRCHIEPQSISPREAKAVVQHMRVRASLSAEDADAILHFLAP